MRKVVRLSESDLISIVKQVLSEGPTMYEKGKNLGQGIKQGVQKAGETVVSIGKTVVKAIAFPTIMMFYLYGKFFQLSIAIGKAVLSFLGSLAKQIGGIVVNAAKQVQKDATQLIKTASKSVADFFSTLSTDILKRPNGVLGELCNAPKSITSRTDPRSP